MIQTGSDSGTEFMIEKVTTLKCPKCNTNEFELWVQKEESVACAKCCGCRSHFLLFDSHDYWFDVIAKGYPRKSRCTCKECIFTLRALYEFRDDGDVKAINLRTTCRACETDKRKLTIKIDYGPTQSLIDEPLIFCANPQIKYKLYAASLYVTPEDIVEIATHLVEERAFLPYSFTWQSGRTTRSSEDLKELCAAIVGQRYNFLYFTSTDIDRSQIERSTAKQEESFWKHNEVIRISSPTRMVLEGKIGLLYYIEFSTEFIQPDATVSAKSAEFAERASNFLKWLEAKYFGARGPLCFDNREEHERLFGTTFTSKRRKTRS